MHSILCISRIPDIVFAQWHSDRVFTFEPSQIVVNQGDKVTLHFADVQGAHYTITVDGVGSFPISRGQIHTVSFTADKVGIINYSSPDHQPSVVGQIVVLPRTA
jgi:plastocyanin